MHRLELLRAEKETRQMHRWQKRAAAPHDNERANPRPIFGEGAASFLVAGSLPPPPCEVVYELSCDGWDSVLSTLIQHLLDPWALVLDGHTAARYANRPGGKKKTVYNI